MVSMTLEIVKRFLAILALVKGLAGGGTKFAEALCMP
jgi:hypothetical protein